jgi:hypothetical protein
VTEPEPRPDPDTEFAALLHEWLNSRPQAYRLLRKAVERWLVAKGL